MCINNLLSLFIGVLCARISFADPLLLKDKGFSIVPPSEWTIEQNVQNLSLFMAAPKKKPSEYPRSIQISRFQRALEINEKTGKIFQETIKTNFSRLSSLQHYTMRQFLLSQLADKRPALIFYSDFDIDGDKMMQVHILASDSQFHYLQTFTDVAEHFNEGNPILAEAWTSMSSFHVLEPQKKSSPMFLIGILIGVFFLIGGGFVFLKQKHKTPHLEDDVIELDL